MSSTLLTPTPAQIHRTLTRTFGSLKPKNTSKPLKKRPNHPLPTLVDPKLNPNAYATIRKDYDKNVSELRKVYASEIEDQRVIAARQAKSDLAERTARKIERTKEKLVLAEEGYRKDRSRKDQALVLRAERLRATTASGEVHKNSINAAKAKLLTNLTQMAEGKWLTSLDQIDAAITDDLWGNTGMKGVAPSRTIVGENVSATLMAARFDNDKYLEGLRMVEDGEVVSDKVRLYGVVDSDDDFKDTALVAFQRRSYRKLVEAYEAKKEEAAQRVSDIRKGIVTETSGNNKPVTNAEGDVYSRILDRLNQRTINLSAASALAANFLPNKEEYMDDLRLHGKPTTATVSEYPGKPWVLTDEMVADVSEVFKGFDLSELTNGKGDEGGSSQGMRPKSELVTGTGEDFEVGEPGAEVASGYGKGVIEEEEDGADEESDSSDEEGEFKDGDAADDDDDSNDSEEDDNEGDEEEKKK